MSAAASTRPATGHARPVRRTALFIITGDPRRSPRPSEAIRIAAGVAAWQQVDVSVVLCGAAGLVLKEFVDELIDPENFREGLPLLAGSGRGIFAHHGSPVLEQLESTSVPFAEMDDDGLAELAARCDVVVRF
jgi:hypothetical protein